METGGGDAAGDLGWADEWASAVVDGDAVGVGGEGGEPVPDGEVAFGAAGDEAAEFGEVSGEGEEGGLGGWGGDDPDGVDVGAELEGVERVAEDRLTGEGSEEFIEAHAGA